VLKSTGNGQTLDRRCTCVKSWGNNNIHGIFVIEIKSLRNIQELGTRNCHVRWIQIFDAEFAAEK